MRVLHIHLDNAGENGVDHFTLPSIVRTVFNYVVISGTFY